MAIEKNNYCKTEFKGNGFLETLGYNFKKEQNKEYM